MVQLVHDSGEPYETVRQTNHLFDIVWDDRVTPAMLRLYLALASYVDRNGNCSPPRSVLAYRLNRKPHPISVAMAGLKQTGWVVETPITTPGGHRLRTAYHLPRLGHSLT